jgi:NAD(P)-dependent dehydrogenase (short-subunit alcohol dehydrogenase family)
MPNTPPPRIVFEASEVHRMTPSNIHFGSLQEINDENFGPTHLYARSKLAMILCAKFILPEKVFKPNGDQIFSLSVHPGTVNTNMQQQWKDAYPGLFGNMLSWAMTTIGRDVEQGSYSALWAATSPEIEEKNLQGYYFVDPVMFLVPGRGAHSFLFLSEKC